MKEQKRPNFDFFFLQDSKINCSTAGPLSSRTKSFYSLRWSKWDNLEILRNENGIEIQRSLFFCVLIFFSSMIPKKNDYNRRSKGSCSIVNFFLEYKESEKNYLGLVILEVMMMSISSMILSNIHTHLLQSKSINPIQWDYWSFFSFLLSCWSLSILFLDFFFRSSNIERNLNLDAPRDRCLVLCWIVFVQVNYLETHVDSQEETDTHRHMDKFETFLLSYKRWGWELNREILLWWWWRS